MVHGNSNCRESELEEKTAAMGREILEEVKKETLSLFNREYYTGKLINWAMEDEDFRVGMVFQAYLRRTEKDAREMLEWLKWRGTPLSIRLVKGAYWDTETITANLKGWPLPVWREKVQSDYQFEKLSRLLLDHPDRVRAAFGSHNIRSLAYAVNYAEGMGLDRTAFEIQTLHGMADPIKRAFSRRGYLVREYAPIGELIPGMGYLVRRLLENTSNSGFIRLGFHEGEDAGKLLEKPKAAKIDLSAPSPSLKAVGEFHNTPTRDFSLPENRNGMRDSLRGLMGRMKSNPFRASPVVEGKTLEGKTLLAIRSPEDRNLLLGEVGTALIETVDSSLHSLRAYFEIWREIPIEKRAECLLGTARILEKRRDELAALMILESGKPWAEADAEVAEAIDFLNYYAEQAIRLFKPISLHHLPGEEDLYFYEPRGVCVVISPWNFPLAIPAGMFAAAFVTGNCAVLKPAEQSPLIAGELFKAFLEGGVPSAAAAFLPGCGETVGARLTESPLVSTIVFTGSKAVGLRIIKSAAEVRPGQEHVKRVIAEMGGKNAVIVDSDADLDAAVKGVIASAFGYAGQKCSACARVIVVEPIYGKFIRRLAEATRSLIVGPATSPGTLVGPVIDERAWKRLHKTIVETRKTARLLAQSPLPEGLGKGYFIPATVFTEIERGDPLLGVELFGPILAVQKVGDFKKAVRVALDTEYGLTGAVFSRSPKNLRWAARQFQVGNLYLNRGCTGALVGRQPFGGARMSGVGSKAGGPDYLFQFVHPRAVCENSMRKGFAPMAD